MTDTTVYLAGPRYEGDNPYAWHELLQSLTNYSLINPFTIHPDNSVGAEIHQRDLEAVRDADALLLNYVSYHETCGAYIEVGVAFENGISVVVWNPEEAELPEFLRWTADAIEANPRDALAAISRVKK